MAVSQQRIDTGVAALIVATFPLWIATFDFAANGRRLRPLAIVGVVVGFVGIALLIRPGGDIDLLGALICLFAPISWTIGSLYARGARLPDNLLLGSGMEMLAGGAVLAVVGFASGERLDVSEVSGRSWLAMAGLILFGSIVAYSCYVWLLTVAPTELVSTYAYVNPVIAVLLGAVFLNEVITGWVLLAGAAIVTSVVLIVRAQSASDRRARGRGGRCYAGRMTSFDLRALKLRSGEQFQDEVEVQLVPLEFGGQRYLPVPEQGPHGVSRHASFHRHGLRALVRRPAPRPVPALPPRHGDRPRHLRP